MIFLLLAAGDTTYTLRTSFNLPIIFISQFCCVVAATIAGVVVLRLHAFERGIGSGWKAALLDNRLFRLKTLIVSHKSQSVDYLVERLKAFC
jgi:hypothetical protein